MSRNVRIAGIAGGAVALALVVWLLVWALGGGGAAEPASGLSLPAAELDAAAWVVAPPEERLAGLDPPPVADALTAIAEGLRGKAAVLDNPEIRDLAQTGRRRAEAAVVERAAEHNWEVRFAGGGTAELYAQQLEFFGIELAVLMPDGQLTYISSLNDPKPTTRTGPAAAEQRYYFTWRKGELPAADRDVLSRAGVESEAQIVLKLLPPKVEQQLAQLERTQAGDKADRVRKTRFGIRPEGAAFAFYVMQQWYK